MVGDTNKKMGLSAVYFEAFGNQPNFKLKSGRKGVRRGEKNYQK